MRNLKRMGAMMMALVLAFSLSVTAFAAVEDTGFADVAADAWYADGVNAMAAKGFFAGDGSAFRPEDTITYEEMVTVLSSVAAWASSVLFSSAGSKSGG